MNKTLILALPLVAILMAGCSPEEKQANNSASKPSSQVVSLRINNKHVSFNEGSYGETQTHTINFGLSKQTAKETRISFRLIDDTAIYGEHYSYNGNSYTLTIPPQSQGFPIDLEVIGNSDYNDDRTFTLQFTNADGIQLPAAAEVKVTIKNNDPLPAVEFDSELITVNQNIGSLSVLLRQDRTSSLDSHINLKFSGLATLGNRYEVDLDGVTAVIPAGEKETRFNIHILNDHIPRGNTNIIAELTAAKNSSVARNNTLTVIVLGQLGLPDTGVTHYYNSGDFNATAPDVEHPHQDALYGRDVDFYPDSFDGYASLSYTKLDLSGNPLPDTSESFHCVRDNTTGLIWEHKMATADGARIMPGASSLDFVDRTFFRYVNDQYLWYTPSASVNGGNEGGTARNDLDRLDSDGWEKTVNTSAGAHCMLPGSNHPYSVPARNGCTTQVYIQALNNSGACGFTDWRVPHIAELSTLGVYDSPSVRMDAKFLLNPMPTASRGLDEVLRYWSATPSADNASSAWCFDLSTGNRMLCQKNAYFRLIAVRGGE